MDQQTVPKAAFDVLVGQITTLHEQIAKLQETVDRLTTIIRKKDEIIEQKNQIILNQNRARFGHSSEQRKYVLNDGQVSMFDTSEQNGIGKTETDKVPDEEPTVTVTAHKRKKKRSLEELCASLPVKEIIEDLPVEQKYNAKGEPLRFITNEEVRRELVKEPEKVYVVKYLAAVYTDPKAEPQTGKADIRRAQTPVPLIPHSYASASVVTDVIIRKYADALPLYRQEQIWKRKGVNLSRGTMANWVITVCDQYLKPIWQKLREHLLKLPVIHADETHLQVNREPGRSAQQESRIWAYASSRRAPFQIRLFQYEQSRKGACATGFLNGFTGILVSDGYSGYNVVGHVTRAGCWAHTARKWLEAMPKGATLENSEAAKGYDYCNRLFALEREFADLPDPERVKERQKYCKPLLDEYFDWIMTIPRRSGKLKDAITYTLNQKKFLCAFLDHGEVDISNNTVENGQRPIVVGRKNWLFCDTPAGAQASVIAYSILESAKANRLNPETYLNHILSVLPARFAIDPNADISDLLPWNDNVIKHFSF